MSLLTRLRKRLIVKRAHVTDPAILEGFLSRPDFPWLISFPRTGSHWLRMIMELYFKRPSLRRVFFYPEIHDYTCYHWHDEDLATKDVGSVIYLYRNPVETIYSQIRYHKENSQDAGRVRYWADIYGRHLSKWLLEEAFTNHKTIIRYERLRSTPQTEFAKVCSHLDEPFDEQRLLTAMSRVSKEDLKRKTPDDEQVVNLSREYDDQREKFRSAFGSIIDSVVFENRPSLPQFFIRSEDEPA